MATIFLLDHTGTTADGTDDISMLPQDQIREPGRNRTIRTTIWTRDGQSSENMLSTTMLIVPTLRPTLL